LLGYFLIGGNKKVNEKVLADIELVGTKPDIEDSVPSFLLDLECPIFVVREFLAGYFGQVEISTDWNKAKISIHSDQADVIILLKKFDLFFQTDHNLIEISNNSISTFMEKIGIRYNYAKNHELFLLKSFIGSRKIDPTMSLKKYCYLTGFGCYMPVINKTESGLKHVYDISVSEPYSSFVAAGFISHNCNKLPRMKSADKAVWNRVRVIPFESTFVSTNEKDEKKKPPASFEDQLKEKRFPMDKTLTDRIPKLVEAFAWVLLQHQKTTVGQAKNEPAKVLAATEHYRQQNDIYRQFIEEHFVEDENGEVVLPEIYNMFREWFRDSRPGHSVPIKDEVEEYLVKLWGEPANKSAKRWKGHRVQTTQEKVGNGIDVAVPLTKIATTMLDV
jgi:hypothetical protein